MACGASGAEIAWRTGPFAPALRSAKSGGLRHLAATQAPRADADALGGAVDQRAHGLEVRLEPPRPDVVGVRHRAADDRTLIADFAALGHVFLAGSLTLVGRRRLASSNQPRFERQTPTGYGDLVGCKPRIIAASRQHNRAGRLALGGGLAGLVDLQQAAHER